MTNEELLELNARRIKDNQLFEGILTNPDFIEWQKQGPLAEMGKIEKLIVNIDRTKPDWKETVCAYVISYQAISTVIMGTINKAAIATDARQKVKDLEMR